MAYPPRFDRPGRLFHVTNRGVARRTLFENEREVKVFLYPLACMIRRELVELVAYVFLVNHFHLLLCSLTGDLSEVMRQVKITFTTFFNRTRHRRGPLFESRFRSKPILTEQHFDNTVRYIDANPHAAGFKLAPDRFPFGSAAFFLAGKTPRWLDTSWLVDRVHDTPLEGLPLADAYLRLYGKALSPGGRRLIDLRLTSNATGPDHLDSLLALSPAGKLAWLVERTRLADGTEPGLPMVDPDTVLEVVAQKRAADSGWMCDPSGCRPRSAWDPLLAALLRDLCAATHAEVGRRLGVTPKAAARTYDAHRRLVTADDTYQIRFQDLADLVLRLCHA